MLNYQGKITDVFILAHEIGHAIHYYLSDKTQSYENSRVKTLATEISALTNEILVYEYLLKKAKERVQQQIEENILDGTFIISF